MYRLTQTERKSAASTRRAQRFASAFAARSCFPSSLRKFYPSPPVPSPLVATRCTRAPLCAASFPMHACWYTHLYLRRYALEENLPFHPLSFLPFYLSFLPSSLPSDLVHAPFPRPRERTTPSGRPDRFTGCFSMATVLRAKLSITRIYLSLPSTFRLPVIPYPAEPLRNIP